MNHNHNGASHLNQRVSSLHFSSALIISKLCLRSQLSKTERAGVATVSWACISDVHRISTGLQNTLKSTTLLNLHVGK